MSYWVTLVDPSGEPVRVEPFQEGGTYPVGRLAEGVTAERAAELTAEYVRDRDRVVEEALAAGDYGTALDTSHRVAQTLEVWRLARAYSDDHEGLVAAAETEATLNVTYNYSRFFDFRALDGARAMSTIFELEEAVMGLGTVTDADYWAPTPGNAGHACKVLLGWAWANPRAVWQVH